VAVGFVVDARSGKTLGFEALFEGDGEAFRRWLEPYAKGLGAEVLVSDDNDSCRAAAAELGLSRRLCIAHVRKNASKIAHSISEQAKREHEGEDEDEDERLRKLEEDLEALEGLLRELPEEGAKRIGRLHREYLWAAPPARKERKTEKATAAYRMRMRTLKPRNDWEEVRLHLPRPELNLDGTNDASERGIGKSKVRYKTTRGHKSAGGTMNGAALTQWLYSGQEEHTWPRRRRRKRSAGRIGKDFLNSPTVRGTITIGSPLAGDLMYSYTELTVHPDRG
jgi:hypothetical protein